jgi:uncharacterized protein YcbX
VIRVSKISIAPVKALGLTHPEEVELGPRGVAENRRFLLLDEGGRHINGMKFGPLVAITPEYDSAAETLVLRFPDGHTVRGEIQLGDAYAAKVDTRQIPVREVLGDYSEAISELAGKPLWLVRAEQPGDAVDRERYPVSLMSTSSLEELRPGLDGRRFRMLFEVDGVETWEEDSWLGGRLRVGEAVVALEEHVGRCAITTQDPDRGVRDFDTLRRLLELRGKNPDTGEVDFGVCGGVAEPGRVRVGDPVEVV